MEGLGDAGAELGINGVPNGRFNATKCSWLQMMRKKSSWNQFYVSHYNYNYLPWLCHLKILFGMLNRLRFYKPAVSHTANRFRTLIHQVLLDTVKVYVRCGTSGTMTTWAMFLRDHTHWHWYITHIISWTPVQLRQNVPLFSASQHTCSGHNPSHRFLRVQREKSDQSKRLTV